MMVDSAKNEEGAAGAGAAAGANGQGASSAW